MNKQSSYGFLPGIDKHVPRQQNLMAWMKTRGWTFSGLARQWDCHWTFPGKCLKAETEELPADKRQWLIDQGFPEDLLPPVWTDRQKKRHNEIRTQRQREIRIQARADKFREEREKRKTSG